MSLREMVLDRELPSDDEVLAALMNAKKSGLFPAQHIGNALQHQILCGKGEFPYIVRKYRKTLDWLSRPDNMEWLINDMERVLKHLKQMSEWLNRQPKP